MLTSFLFIVALVFLLADTFELKVPHVNLQSAGLLCLAGALLSQMLMV